MSLKVFSLVMDVTAAQPGRPLAEVAPAVLEGLRDVFAPRLLWVQIDGGEPFQISALAEGPAARQPLWRGEEPVSGFPLTRCNPGPLPGLLDELRARLRGRSPASLFLGADGALRHRACDRAEPDWYGRWTADGGLLDIAAVRVQWTADLRGFELGLPHSGYPFTASRLAADGTLEDGDAEVAAANRAAIIPALAAVRPAFGLSAAQARWHDDGDYAALFQADADDLRRRWIPWLDAA